jgi:hypothetical protein
MKLPWRERSKKGKRKDFLLSPFSQLKRFQTCKLSHAKVKPTAKAPMAITGTTPAFSDKFA